MGFIKSLTKSVIDTALVPVDTVKDLATLGDENYNLRTTKRLKKVKEDLEDAYDSLDE